MNPTDAPARPFTRDPAASFASRLDDLAVHLGDSDHGRSMLRRVRAMMRGVDEAAIQRLRERYAAEIAAGSRKGEYKFLDVVFYTYKKFLVARELGLDGAEPMDILDIGSGAGHFALVCRFLGHRVAAVDIPNPVYDVAAPALNVTRRMHRVEAGVPLPDLGRRFDLVTAMGVNFNKLFEPGETPKYWTLDQWRGFLADVADRQVRRPGRLWLRLNCEDRPDGRVYNPELLAFARAQGAQVDERRGVIDWRLDGGRA